MTEPVRSFADYKDEKYQWVTPIRGQYYPDYLVAAAELYKPVLEKFRDLLDNSATSQDLFNQISSTSGTLRVQLWRIFRKYVSPETSVEMLKVKQRASDILANFGAGFRPIDDIRAAFGARSVPDEALAAILWEYQDRGQSGYNLTEQFFALFRAQFQDLPISGPERAGKDILLGEVFTDYPNPKRPVDFVIYRNTLTPAQADVLIVGLARYDSDRGGAQEDDRIGGYRNCADEVLRFAESRNLATKVVFINDGPGLLLGSMWDDYSALETSHPGKVMVLTLRMIPERLSLEWIYS